MYGLSKETVTAVSFFTMYKCDNYEYNRDISFDF